MLICFCTGKLEGQDFPCPHVYVYVFIVYHMCTMYVCVIPLYVFSRSRNRFLTALWAWQFNQLSIHLTVVHLSSVIPQLVLKEAAMGKIVQSLAEVEINNIHGSPLIHWANHLLIEGYELAQAWFPLHKSMHFGKVPTIPDFPERVWELPPLSYHLTTSVCVYIHLRWAPFSPVLPFMRSLLSMSTCSLCLPSQDTMSFLTLQWFVISLLYCS